jgi:hypothetical protein
MVNGSKGAKTMQVVKEALQMGEDHLARLCVAAGRPPEEGASTNAWDSWYRWCADYVQELEGTLVPTEGMQAVTDEIRRLADERDRPLPDVVGVQLRHWQKDGDTWMLTPWSSFDWTPAPSWIFGFFSRLDGHRPWKIAQAELEAETGHRIADALVQMLWTKGILVVPEELDAQPGVAVRMAWAPAAAPRWNE